MHKREEEPVSSVSPNRDHVELMADAEPMESVSPVAARATDQTVKRATQGLIKLESRRRLRSLVRRLIYITLVTAPFAVLWYMFGDTIVDRLSGVCEQIFFHHLRGDSEFP